MTETPPGQASGPSEGGEPPTPTESPPQGSEGAQGAAAAPEPPTEGEPPDERSRLRREAARYRTERNEAREQRDRLRQEVGAFQRNAAEAIAAERLEDAADLWRDGVQLSDVLADDGTIDGDRVVEAVERVVEAHPAWAKGRRASDPDFAAGAGRASVAPAPSFGEMLKQVRGRPG